MSRILIVFSLFAVFLFACKPKATPTPIEEVIAEPVVEPIVLPDVEFLDKSKIKSKAPSCELKVDYNLDTIQYIFNGNETTFEELPIIFEDWRQSTRPNGRYQSIILYLKADEVTPIVDIYDIKLLMRQLVQLRLSYENRTHHILSTKLPHYHPEAGLQFKSPRTPEIKVINPFPSIPPPPIAEELKFTGPNKACVFKNGQFVFRGKTYESCKDCVVAARRPYFEITLQENEILMNGKSLAIDSLETALMDILNTLDEEVIPIDANIFNKMLILYNYDMKSDYGHYLSVYSQLMNCYTQLRNRRSMELFNRKFKYLDTQEKRTIRSLIPMIIADYIK